MTIKKLMLFKGKCIMGEGKKGGGEEGLEANKYKIIWAAERNLWLFYSQTLYKQVPTVFYFLIMYELPQTNMSNVTLCLKETLNKTKLFCKFIFNVRGSNLIWTNYSLVGAKCILFTPPQSSCMLSLSITLEQKSIMKMVSLRWYFHKITVLSR